MPPSKPPLVGPSTESDSDSDCVIEASGPSEACKTKPSTKGGSSSWVWQYFQRQKINGKLWHACQAASQPKPSQIDKKSTKLQPNKKGTGTLRAVLKTVTSTPTPKKAVVSKEETDDIEDEDDGFNEENEEVYEEGASELKEVQKKNSTKGARHKDKRPLLPPRSARMKSTNDKSDPKDNKKKKPNHNWTKEQCNFCFTAFGEGTDNGNMKAAGWTTVRKNMFKQFNTNFNDEQVKDQRGLVCKLNIDMKFRLKLSGFKWCLATKMVTANEDTWDEFIEAHPKRMFATLCKGNNSWLKLAQDPFEPSGATGPTSLLPGGQAPSISENKEANHVLSNMSGLSTNSIKRRKVAAQMINVDSSGNDKVEDANIKPNIKQVVPPGAKPEPTLLTRQVDIKLMASMYSGQVPTMDYI
ncbi:hypothetical protein MJO29_006566 [Puccinia striiformis f. sp. tritici]|nr:hypothetical protein MJO29_006566 [Puccinia striiformis f. sp. tritici]